MTASEIKLDFQRQERIGFGEAALCAQKTVLQIEAILAEAEKQNTPFLLTRLSENQFRVLPDHQRKKLDYDPESQTAFFLHHPKTLMPPKIAVVTAGTSDSKVAREALRTLEFNGLAATGIFDVGVAGLWRLLERVEEIRQHPIIIAAAGMDAAMPSVLGGLVSGTLIAVPTSTGYGVALKGETAFAASLASCAPGIVVCNIDNGYGAACAALRIISAAKMMTSSS